MKFAATTNIPPPVPPASHHTLRQRTVSAKPPEGRLKRTRNAEPAAITLRERHAHVKADDAKMEAYGAMIWSTIDLQFIAPPDAISAMRSFSV